MSACSGDTKSFAHESFDLEEVLVVVKMKSMRKTSRSLVVLDCEKHLSAFGVPVFLKELLVELNLLILLKLPASLDVFVIKFFSHASAQSVVASNVRASVTPHQEVLAY